MDTIATAATKPAIMPNALPDGTVPKRLEECANELFGLAEALDVIGHPEADHVLQDDSLTRLAWLLAGAARRVAYEIEAIGYRLAKPPA